MGAGVSKWEVKTSKIGGFNSLHTPAMTQVDQVMAVPGRVVGRTRVKRSEYRVLGDDQQEGEDGEDPEEDRGRRSRGRRGKAVVKSSEVALQDEEEGGHASLQGPQGSVRHSFKVGELHGPGAGGEPVAGLC